MCSFPIIKRWLAWEIGSWNRAILGHDPFIGCKSSFKLSVPLIQFLNSLSIFSIAQAVVPDDSGSKQVWLESSQLGLSDRLKTEWEKFVTILKCSGIHLKNTNDKIVWTWNRSTGEVTTNLAYQSILYLNQMEERRWWYKSIWKVNIPVKMICFVWLCLKDCILSGVNYKKIEGKGPYACSLCLRDEETTTHLFLDCSKTKTKNWSEVMKSLKMEGEWNCSSIEENLKLWFLQFPKMRYLPFLVIWGIWKFRNKILFEN
jgi:hypothetical protein